MKHYFFRLLPPRPSLGDADPVVRAGIGFRFVILPMPALVAPGLPRPA